MAQEIINIGTAANDGLGDPLRTAFQKTNNNFTQLYSISGITGIANGTSNVQIPQANGNVTISAAGASNVLIVTGAGVATPGTLDVTGLATLANLSVTGTVISTGTIQSLADVTAVDLSASANISAAGYLFGDGGYISNITAVSNLAVTLIANGTTSVATTGSGANVAVSVGGASNVTVFATTGQYVAGVLSASGNVIGGNINTGGLITATGGIFSNAVVSAVGNVSGGNVVVNGLVTATGNISGSNLLTAGLISAAGNVSGNYFVGNGSQLTGLSASKIYNGTSEANIGSSGGNANITIGGTSNVVVVATTGVYVSGEVSATGNVTGNYILGNGALLTGVITSVANINNGTSNVTVVSSGGNVSVGVGGTSNVAVWASTGEYITGLISATGNVTGGNINTGGLISATGNITGGNILTGGLISATGSLTVNSGASATAIVNGAGNAVGNIGSSSTYFNLLFAQATTALYADLAEVYSADAEYPPGTVVSFGGTQEIRKSEQVGDPRVAGVISENPSYLMNSGLQAEHRAVVALTGRVPTLVLGPVVKGDMMISGGNGHAIACATPAIGTVIGKALENFSGDSGTIEIVVGIR